MSRIREDCAAGDRWACHLLDSLEHAKSTLPVGSPHTRGDALLLVVDGIGVDCCGGELYETLPITVVVQNGGTSVRVPSAPYPSFMH
jgi:hypothetical protein